MQCNNENLITSCHNKYNAHLFSNCTDNNYDKKVSASHVHDWPPLVLLFKPFGQSKREWLKLGNQGKMKL